TRFSRDWSSDVCSSDLYTTLGMAASSSTRNAIRQPIAFLVELLAAIPSVVYGLWGIFVLIPFLRSAVVPPLKAVLGWTPFLQGEIGRASCRDTGQVLRA